MIDLKNKKNIGYLKSSIKGLSQAERKYIIFISDDDELIDKILSYDISKMSLGLNHEIEQGGAKKIVDFIKSDFNCFS